MLFFGRLSLVFLLTVILLTVLARRKRYPTAQPVLIPKFDIYTLNSLMSYRFPPNRPRPMIIDCIQYSTHPITLYRMIYLKDAVDLFVLMEMKGSDNKYQMDSPDLPPFIKSLEKENKILKMRLESFPYEFKYRQNDTDQPDSSLFRMTPFHFRDAKVKHAGLLPLAKEKYLIDAFFHEFKNKFAGKPYILIFGAADEIPRKEILLKLPSLYGHPALQSGLRLEMPTFYYHFKWIVPEERVRNTIVIQDTPKLQEMNSLMDLRWYENEFLPLIFSAGWHCSYFITPAEMKQYIRTELPEYNLPGIMNGSWIDECKQNGLDVFRREFVFIAGYEGGEGYPTCKLCAKEVSYYPHFRIPS
jgi:hypothetical protein